MPAYSAKLYLHLGVYFFIDESHSIQYDGICVAHNMEYKVFLFAEYGVTDTGKTRKNTLEKNVNCRIQNFSAEVIPVFFAIFTTYDSSNTLINTTTTSATSVTQLDLIQPLKNQPVFLALLFLVL
jgi:hypothetical protein